MKLKKTINTQSKNNNVNINEHLCKAIYICCTNYGPSTAPSLTLGVGTTSYWRKNIGEEKERTNIKRNLIKIRIMIKQNIRGVSRILSFIVVYSFTESEEVKYCIWDP